MRKRVTNWLERGGPRLPFLLLPDARAAGCRRPSHTQPASLTPSKYRKDPGIAVRDAVTVAGLTADLGWPDTPAGGLDSASFLVGLRAWREEDVAWVGDGGWVESVTA